MRKVKQSKKYWALTEAQKRKDRTKKFHYYSNKCPRWFCRTFHKKYKSISNNSLLKVKRGFDPYNLDYKTLNHKHIAKGYWY